MRLLGRDKVQSACCNVWQVKSLGLKSPKPKFSEQASSSPSLSPSSPSLSPVRSPLSSRRSSQSSPPLKPLKPSQKSLRSFDPSVPLRPRGASPILGVSFQSQASLSLEPLLRRWNLIRHVSYFLTLPSHAVTCRNHNPQPQHKLPSLKPPQAVRLCKQSTAGILLPGDVFGVGSNPTLLISRVNACNAGARCAGWFAAPVHNVSCSSIYCLCSSHSSVRHTSTRPPPNRLSTAT